MDIHVIDIKSPAFAKVQEIAFNLGREDERKLLSSMPKPDNREWVKAADAVRLSGFETSQALVYHRIEDGTEVKGKMRFRPGKKHYMYNRQDCENFSKNRAK